MPSVTAPQHRKMAMDCKNPGADKGKPVPQATACEFMHADKGRKLPAAKAGKVKRR